MTALTGELQRIRGRVCVQTRYDSNPRTLFGVSRFPRQLALRIVCRTPARPVLYVVLTVQSSEFRYLPFYALQQRIVDACLNDTSVGGA